MYQSRRSGAGFTLLEVLIALAILTVVITGVVASMVQRGKTQSYLEEKSAAMALVNNLAAEYRLSGQPLEPAIEDGVGDMAGVEFYWRRTLSVDDGSLAHDVTIQAWLNPEAPLYMVTWRF